MKPRIDILDRRGRIVASTNVEHVASHSTYVPRRWLQACPTCDLLVEVGGPHRCERAA